ncbi:MAG: ribonuclease H family protein [Chloroflexi bacterium]|nr:ribonuclease H family protein [Chloroflexota bacterium]
MAKTKVYVVWVGRRPGIYRSWAECAAQVDGFPGARYKSFETDREAQEAFRQAWQQHIGVKPSSLSLPSEVIANSLAVDAACDGSPGNLEYRGVHTQTGEEVFHVGPVQNGTNNLGEFLAIVHALALLKKQGKTSPIYSDSRIARNWVKEKAVRSKLPRNEQTAEVWALADRALQWLENNSYPNEILEWQTEEWGENRADFGRK